MQEPLETEGKNIFWIHYIRAVVALGVILVHVAADVITEWGVLPQGWWWSANIYDSLARGCVPVFIMVSGALLLPVQEGSRDFFSKRLKRIFIPFMVWSLLYLVWKKIFFIPDMTLMTALEKMLTANVCFHLWFFYVLTGMYLMTPLLRILAQHATRRDILYFLVLWFMAGSLAPFIYKITAMYGHPLPRINLYLEPVTGFIGYFVLGHFIRQHALPSWRNGAWIIWALTLLSCAVGTGMLAQRFNSFKEAFYDNMAPNIVFYCASFFIWVKLFLSPSPKAIHPGVEKIVVWLSRASLGIYLIHPMVLDIMEKGRLGFVLKPVSAHPAVMIPLLAGTGYLASFLAVSALQRIPVLRKIV